MFIMPASQGNSVLKARAGYRMGHASIDVRVFERFFKRLGLNVLIPVLPLHGPRSRARHSGTGSHKRSNYEAGQGLVLSVILGVVLGFGMSWSLIRQRVSGQTSVDRVDT